MRKADKLFQITNLIRARAPITAQQIADEMNLSVRTVYRYIDDLSASGIPVFGVTGKGYRLTENYQLPPLNLTAEELEALMLAVGMVQNWTGKPLKSAAKSLLHKIESTQPQAAQQVAQNLPANVANYFEDSPYQVIWEQLYLATKLRYTLRIDYENMHNEHSSREVYPLGLFYWGDKWTLGAWCKTRQAYRAFRIDRIKKLTPTNHSIPNDSRFTQACYIQTVKPH